MPNWCMNNLTISHDDPSKLQEFADAYNSGSVCEHFIPQPDDLGSDAFGENGWYTWNMNNWGTKWDFGKEEYDMSATVDNNEIILSYNTAWSPPTPLYDHLVELGYKIRASYFEPGCGFCGIYYDGYDHFVEYDNHDMIPVAIWNEYNLDEFFEMVDGEM